MNYQVLARKWRPQNFHELVGQQHVLKALLHALREQRLHHAYLFTGTRGVGKTTIARILAKCLNCEAGISPEPCGVCHACTAIAAGNYPDLIEVDAASRTKVEDTRELLDNLQYAPLQGRFKVYIIDEVHMLSGHSFNALLKTLEEPPDHIKFLLATTDPQKLPITVLSRCLQFHLKHLSEPAIRDQLAKILQAEQIAYEEPTLAEIARAASGSMRDALSLLDQAIAQGDGQVTELEVEQMLGTVSRGHIAQLLQAFAENNGTALLHTARECVALGYDPHAILEQLSSSLHVLSLHQMLPDLIQESAELTDEMKAHLSSAFSPEDVQLLYQMAIMGRRDLAYAPSLQQGLEMTLLRMLAFKPVLAHPMELPKTQAMQTPVIQKPVIQTEPVPTKAIYSNPIHTNSTPINPTQLNQAQMGSAKIESQAVESVKVESLKTESLQAEPIKKEVPKTESPKSEPITHKFNTPWEDIIPQLDVLGLTAALANNCIFKEIAGKNLSLTLNKRHSALYNEDQRKMLQNALNRYAGVELNLKITVDEIATETPAIKQRQQREAKHQSAVEKIQGNPHVQTLVERFDARLDPESVEFD
jgi:DNA polymerase-3 subunit gamma/tau